MMMMQVVPAGVHGKRAEIDWRVLSIDDEVTSRPRDGYAEEREERGERQGLEVTDVLLA